MWDNAIKAIQENNINWIKENRLDFQQFFKQQNLKPQGKLSRQALERHYQTKLFKMFLAKNHNGLAQKKLWLPAAENHATKLPLQQEDMS